MLWEQLRASPATQKKGTEAKATKGAAVDGETNGRGIVAAKRRGRQLQKPFRFCYAYVSHLVHDESFANAPASPHCPARWGCTRNNPWRRRLGAPNAHARPNHAPQHHLSLCTHTMPGCRSPSVEGQMDDDLLGLLRGPRSWRGTSGDPRGTYLQTFLPSGSSSWAELCTHSHSWRQRMGRALPIPAGHEGSSPGGSPAPRQRPSVLSLPQCGLFLPPALGFFLRKRGRRRPDPDVRGAVGRGRQGMLPHGLFLALAATLAAEMGAQGLGAATQGLVPA